MVVCESNINNIIGGIENTGGVTLHNHRRKLKQRFDIIKKLGQGTYGKVQLGINKETGQEVAIKTIKKCKIETEADLVRIRREIQIMSSVQHPNIIHIYEVFENREKMVLVMEYAAGGELYDYLSERKVLNEEEARRIFRQIVTAVYYCHKHKICHRDLKLENILLDEHGSAKIADFGLSNVFDDRRLLSTFCGSPLYASPEIVKGTPYHGPEVDCWSLGVLLYTLVYGAMPFDGSNFKRLVKQISHGDYFEPKKPSPASPLIRDMLTVSPEERSNIEKICAHWWVNVEYKDACLDVAEELANQTPVRLDLLLSLAPPPPQVGSDKLVVTDEASSANVPAPDQTTSAPARSQSVGSLMELAPSAERRIRDLQTSPKRKLEVTVSTENANQSSTGAKRKERPIKKEKESILPPSETIMEEVSKTDIKNDSVEKPVIIKSATEPIKEMEVDPVMEANNNISEEKMPEIEGAACKELLEELSKMGLKKEDKVAEKETEQKPSEDSKPKDTDVTVTTEPEKPPEKEKKIVKKIIKRKVPSAKKLVENNVAESSKKAVETKPITMEVTEAKKVEEPKKLEENKKVEEPKKVVEEIKKVDEPITPPKPIESTEETKNGDATPPSKPIERRRSKIFETAEKLQNMAKGNDVIPKIVDKPKKIFIPGVNVGGFKKEFERKASLTSTAPLLKNTNSIKNVPSVTSPNGAQNGTETKLPETVNIPKQPGTEVVTPPKPISPPIENVVPEVKTDDDELKKRRQTAVSIISSAISKEGARKSKSRPCILRKTPIPFGASGRSASGNITTLPLSPTEIVSNIRNTISEESLESGDSSSKLSKTPSDVSQKSTMEIMLKSATLPPQRKTVKAEIKLNYPPPKPVTMEFKTEVAHHIEAPQDHDTFVGKSSPMTMKFRSSSCDPDMKGKDSPKERIIPISFEKEDKPEVPTLQAKPPMPKNSHSMRSLHRHGSISRQSTQDSDSEVTLSENIEPIKKSPKEYIIPIAVEGGGYVTPRATSTEPSESSSSLGRQSVFKFGRTKRMSSLLNEDEESPASTLHRHNSTSRDSDNEDSRKEPFHMHRLRSSRPTRKISLEHADSLSSAEEDDDDDGFEILTAENLFSTLLSRVRNLTQRLNVEDNGSRLGFPSSRLLGDFDRGSKMFMNDPMSRYSLLDQTFNRERRNARSPSAGSGTPWRRSVSRDLANDIEKVFNNTPTAGATLPRGKSRERSEVNLSNEDTLALSYLTPGLSRRIRKHLLSSQLPSSHSSRSLSRNKDTNIKEETDSETNSEITNEKQPSTLKNKIINRINRSISQDRGMTNKYSKTQEKTTNDSAQNNSDTLPDKPDLYYYRSLSRDSNENKNTGDQKTNNLNDIITLSSLYNSRMPVRSISPIVSNSTSKQYTSPNYSEVGSKPSRFLKSSFHEDYSRKNKEKETQKVLREIRKKRDSKEEKANKTEDKINKSEDKYKDENITRNDNVNKKLNDAKVEKSTENKSSSDKSEMDKPKTEIVKKSRISKLLRPKSYPADSLEQNDDYNFNVDKNNATVCNGIRKSSEEPSSSSSCKDNKTSTQKQITQSSRNRTSSKTKTDKKSKVESTIRSLRERSLPHDTDYCGTESNLIKRAVSLEDFSALSPPVSFKDKALQTSRKSVSKILGLFEKYDQSKSKQKIKKSPKNDEGDKKEDSKKNSNSKIKHLTKDITKKTKIPESSDTSADITGSSKIPVCGIKKIETTNKLIGNDRQLSPLEILKLQDELNKKERKSERDRIPKLKLDLKDENDYRKERETSILISPSDEMTDNSICSDSQYHDSSPNSVHKIFSDDEECESVSERIHRKSFYSRFNEKKKKKKSASVGAYDFKEYMAKFDEPISEPSTRKLKSYDVRSSNNRSFNSSYSSLRQPISYSRQNSHPIGNDGSYSYNPYGDVYKSSKKSQPSGANYLPGTSKGSVAEGKDPIGKTSKHTSQINQSSIKSNDKSNETNLNDGREISLLQGSSSLSRSSYVNPN